MLETRTSLHSDLLDVFWNEQQLGGSALPVPIETGTTDTLSDSIAAVINQPRI
mgnify:CR=1 FL=1